jgi:hypothetical protein
MFVKPSLTGRTLTDLLWDVEPTFKSTVTASLSTINPTEADIVSQIVSQASLDLLVFFEDVLKKLNQLINPDENQLDDTVKAAYPRLFTGNRFEINPDKDFYENANVVKLFPNIV